MPTATSASKRWKYRKNGINKQKKKGFPLLGSLNFLFFGFNLYMKNLLTIHQTTIVCVHCIDQFLTFHAAHFADMVNHVNNVLRFIR